MRICHADTTVDTGNRHSWRIPFNMLRHIADICVSDCGQEGG